MATYAIVDASNLVEVDRFYVYALLDPSLHSEEFTYQPFYIGKGKNGRAWTHVKGHKSAGYNPLKESRIRKIKSGGLEPKVSILEYFDTEEEALTYEANVILSLGRLNNHSGNLTNLTEGGDGGTAGIPCSDAKKAAISLANTGKKRSPEYREKLSQRMKGSVPWNKGKTLSEEYRRKLSESHIGKTQTSESNLKRSLSQSGRLRPPEVVARIVATRKAKQEAMDPEELIIKRSEAAKKAWETKRNKERK